MSNNLRALLTAAAALGATLAAGAARAQDRPTPSGFPVPRYVSLKFDKVNARSGPGDDHRLLWVYRVRGLPMQVVAETTDWRRVCDPDGSLVWIHRRTTAGRRTAMNVGRTPEPLHRRPKETSRIVAYLRPRSLASIVRCEEGWCRVKADDTSGWVRQGELWGTSEGVQCRARPRGETDAANASGPGNASGH